MHSPIHLSRTAWLCAALGALAIHAGGAAVALGYLRADDSDVDLGAPAIEIGVELAAPKVDPTDLPVGPDTEASAAAPEVIEQKAVPKQSELPKATPEESDDSERVVSPADDNKPKDDDPKVATIQAQPSEQSLATEATATPTVDGAREAPQSVAPAQGTGASTQRVRATWEKELAAHFNKYKRYPSDRTMQPAEVVVSFALDRVGHVLSSSIVKGSGDASFDAEALAMLARSDPVPAPPPVVADEGLTFTLPVIFQVKKQN